MLLTGSQLSLLPIQARLGFAAPPSIFGISGYSGAGTTPSKKNDPAYLKDNLVPYSLTGHMHERYGSSVFRDGPGRRADAPAPGFERADANRSEVSYQLQHQVRFMPHVAPFFQGITLTVAVPLAK